ncbi:hypothetical protein [Duganella vulcania]|uniref:Secreted protein n=1 Tax=Duganella vulcania TaxID=2692166 RepID=A0A845GEP1_9BURK|nr:hypothetical protein [Duganella vulcania]MYM92371.1 hypothetical protein [Duganella vulcania]
MLKQIVLASLLIAAGAALAADSQPSTPVITRAALQALSPLVIAALEEIEADRGQPIPESELAELLQSEEFAAKYKQVRKQFCTDPANHHYVICMADDTNTDNHAANN